MITEILLGALLAVFAILVVRKFLHIIEEKRIEDDLNDFIEELEDGLKEALKRHPIFEDGQMVQHRLSGEKMLILKPENFSYSKDFNGFYRVRMVRENNYFSEVFKEEELEAIKVSVTGSKKKK